MIGLKKNGKEYFIIMFMGWWGGYIFRVLFRQQRPCWCNVLGDGGGEAVSGGLCDPNRGVLPLQLSLLLAGRGVQIRPPLPHALKMPTPSRRIPLPSPFFPFVPPPPP